jgi:septal ring factor EnvC (AmiA/AmiB activator)
MDEYLRIFFNSLGSDKLKEMMGIQISKLKSHLQSTDEQLIKLKSHLEKFKKINDVFNFNNNNNNNHNNSETISN